MPMKPLICLNCNKEFLTFRSKSGWCQVCYPKCKKAEWYQRNKERLDEKNHNWRINNPERTKEIQKVIRKRHYIAHRKEMIAYHAKRNAINLKINPMAKLRHAVRRNMHGHFKNKGIVKSKHTIDYIGCTWDQLWKHFEKQFEPDMTWDNYGEVWNIEHICPCAQAQTEDEIFKLQHFSNLKPLYIELNLQKNSNYTPEAEQLCRTLLGREWRVRKLVSRL